MARTAGRSESSSATTTPGFSLTPRQIEANRLLGSTATHIMLRGGSRSGKTFLICRAIAIRAMRKPSSHAILRFKRDHLKQSIVEDTWPKMWSLCFPDAGDYKLQKSDLVITVPGTKSRILFGGLDDAQRTEKILGQEHSTMYLNECSQISYDARNKAVTRLAQKSGLPLRFYYDCNPPTVGHWTFGLFERHIEPRSRRPLADPNNYASMMMNPVHNLANLPAEVISELQALPEKDRLRFLEGQYLSQVDNALWTYDSLEKCRVGRDKLPDMQRIVVSVDPSGCSGPEDTRSDEIGITVCGMDHKRRGYVLEDLSGRYSPEGWANAALTAFDRWQADRIVCEGNFGGAMVENTIKAVRRGAAVKMITASRGKAQRAEPIAALYEKGEIFHVEALPDLEEQLCNFSTAGYQGPHSPDRADAAIWGLSDLMLGFTPSSPYAMPIINSIPRGFPSGMPS